MRKINLIIIHCSATDKPHNINDIDEWHRVRSFKRNSIPKDAKNTKNLHIGYHYLINKDGSIEPCRDESEVGAHVRNYNHSSIGICFIGSNLFTEEQFKSGRKLIKDLMIKYKLEPKDIIAHCQLDNNKTCPNFNINDKIISKLNEE